MIHAIAAAEGISAAREAIKFTSENKTGIAKGIIILILLGVLSIAIIIYVLKRTNSAAIDLFSLPTRALSGAVGAAGDAVGQAINKSTNNAQGWLEYITGTGAYAKKAGTTYVDDPTTPERKQLAAAAAAANATNKIQQDKDNAAYAQKKAAEKMAALTAYGGTTYSSQRNKLILTEAGLR